MSSTPSKRPAKLHEAASQWVTILHSGTATPAERQAFARWLAESESHRRAYREMETFWQDLGTWRQDFDPQLAAAQRYFVRAQRRNRLLRSGLALAASVLLMVIASPLWRLWLDNGVYRTARGEQAHVELSDGTRIDLNTDSEVEVAYLWSERRVMLTRGEAFFTVVHDPEHPFRVAAADGVIRDIGTRFNVYREDDRVTVTVLEGEVGIGSAHASVSQILRPGMQSTYRQDGFIGTPRPVETGAATAWREGRLVFKSRPLDEVLVQLGRYHAVDLALDDVSLKSLKVSGSFSTGDLDLALNTIAAGLPIKVVRRGAGQVALIPADGPPKR